MDWERWLLFIKDFLIIALVFFCAIKSYKYIRAFFKRVRLLRRIKKICRQKGYVCTTKRYFLSISRPKGDVEMQIKTADKTYAIKFFACLKRTQTYVFNNQGNYYTTNNFNPILIAYGSPKYTVLPKNDEEGKLYTPRVMVSNNQYIVQKETKSGISLSGTENDVVPLLCLHPISIKVMVVRNNHPEQLFDGEEFQGYTVYSGEGLCKFLSALH